MADEPTPAKGEPEKTDDPAAKAPDAPKEPEKKEPEKPASDPEVEAIAAKADNPDAVRNALNAERTAAKEAREEAERLAAKVREFEDKDKSDQQKLEEKATTAEGRAAKAEATAIRLEVAFEKQLPRALADRLVGETKADLEKDADRLLELVKPNQAADPDARKGEPADNDMESWTPAQHAARKYGTPSEEPAAPLTGAKRRG